jgi:hypothetical protein
MYPPMHAHTFRFICAVNFRIIKVPVCPGHTIPAHKLIPSVKILAFMTNFRLLKTSYIH